MQGGAKKSEGEMDLKKLKDTPRVPLIGGLLFFALGLCLLVWPEPVLTIFPPLLGTIMVLVGALLTAHSLIMWQRLMQPGFKLLRGVVNIVVGLIFIVKHDFTLAFLSILFGLYILVMAAIDFSDAMQNLGAKKPWLAGVVQAVAKFALGIVLLFAPFSGRVLWARVLGVYFMLAAGNMLHWLLFEKKQEPQENKEPEGGQEE